MGYTVATIRELAKQKNEVYVVHWDHKKLTPYKAPVIPNVFMYKRSELTDSDLMKFTNNIKPDIVVVSGWMDKGYMGVAKKLRKEGVPVVLALDTQWEGSFKQWIAVLVSKIGYFNRFYSHAWVAGLYQFEYVRKLGFKKHNIIFDLYSADLELFFKFYNESFHLKTRKYPHRFLFVGRLEKIKGIDILLSAWRKIEKYRGNWELHLIGNGSFSTFYNGEKALEIKDFMQPEELVREIAGAGCFVLPSRYEPWGVVVHEFAAAGLPIIASDVVGASSKFLIHGLNGYLFKSSNAEQLATAMRLIIEQPDEILIKMGQFSHYLSHRITPITSAANLLSIAPDDKKTCRKNNKTV